MMAAAAAMLLLPALAAADPTSVPIGKVNSYLAAATFEGDYVGVWSAHGYSCSAHPGGAGAGSEREDDAEMKRGAQQTRIEGNRAFLVLTYSGT